MTSAVSQSSQAPERAIIVAVQRPDQAQRDVDASVEELTALLSGLGLRVTRVVTQRRAGPGALGSGRLNELARELGVESDATDDDESFDEPEGEARVETDVVVFDGELLPGEARRMQRALGVAILDRTQIILRVFQERAQTREAELEIELARLQYEAPRLRDMDDRHGKVGGGGRGGKGHTGVELSKQRLRDRSAELRHRLEELHATRSAHKERRADTHKVALVGYTNAGKSSLMRALTGSDVLVEDKLFATLGTTVRVLQPETVPRILVSDTVGFIRNLPHALVASFRATLAEAHEADLLLHVADASSPDLDAQIAVTNEVLAELGAAHIPTRLVLNKVDKIDEELRAALHLHHPDAVFLSTRAPELVAQLRRDVVSFFEAQLVRFRLALGYSELSRLAPLRGFTRILSESYDDVGVAVEALCTESEFSRLEASFSGGISRLSAGPPVAEQV